MQALRPGKGRGRRRSPKRDILSDNNIKNNIDEDSTSQLKDTIQKEDTNDEDDEDGDLEAEFEIDGMETSPQSFL